MAETIVWNYIYLRNNIFSFLRNNPKNICHFCNCVLIWDKQVKNFIRIPSIFNEYGYSYSEHDKLSCFDCWYGFNKNNLLSPII